MKSSITKNLKVEISDIDFDFKFNLISLMKEFQLLATEHSTEMGMGYFDLKEKESAFWVLSKVKLRFLSSCPMLGENISVLSYPKEPRNVKFVRNFKLLDCDKQVVALGSSEWCILDSKTRRIRRASSIASYPTEFNHIQENLETELYAVIDDTIEKGMQPIYEKVVRTSDLDINLHMNNVVYTRAVLDSFSSAFLKERTLKEYELHFLKEAPEGVSMNIYKKETEDGIVVFGKDKETSQSYFRALLKFI